MSSIAETQARRAATDMATRDVPEGILRAAREDARKSRLPQTIWHTTDPDAPWVNACAIMQKDGLRSYERDGYELEGVVTVIDAGYFDGYALTASDYCGRAS